MTHNGYKNYATWRVNLEIVDRFIGYIDTPFDSIFDLGDCLKSAVEGFILGAAPNGFEKDYASAFLSEVDWYEIAKNQADERPELILPIKESK